MSACADQELLLGGLLDNELDAANVAMVEAHVARCEDCRDARDSGHAGRRVQRDCGHRIARSRACRRGGARTRDSPPPSAAPRLPSAGHGPRRHSYGSAARTGHLRQIRRATAERAVRLAARGHRHGPALPRRPPRWRRPTASVLDRSRTGECSRGHDSKDKDRRA